jgi:ERCC4-type nuclease
MSLVTPIGQRFNRKTKKYEDVTKTPVKFEFIYPDGFVLVRDTREQVGLFTKPPRGLLVVREPLPLIGIDNKYGDYSIKGFESCIMIEHKEIDDLWTSVTVEANEFERKMVALSKYERKWLVVNGLESEYLSWRQGRAIHPNQIRQALASIEGRIGVPVHQSENIASTERWMLDVFIKFYKEKRGL